MLRHSDPKFALLWSLNSFHQCGLLVLFNVCMNVHVHVFPFSTARRVCDLGPADVFCCLL